MRRRRQDASAHQSWIRTCVTSNVQGVDYIEGRYCNNYLHIFWMIYFCSSQILINFIFWKKPAGTYTSSSISSSSSSSSGEPGTSYTSYISSSNSPSGTSSSHSHGTSSSSSTVNGVTTTVRNGIDSNGNAYSTETTEKKVNGAVHRTVKTWNSETQTYDVSRYIVYPNQKAVAVDSFDNE